MVAISLSDAAVRLRRLYRGWWIALVCYYTQLITIGAGGWIFGVLILSMQSDFGWSQKAIVGVLLLNRWIGGTLSFALGPIADRYGSRYLMTFGALFAGLGLIAVSLSHNAWTYYAAWALFGAARPGIGQLGPRVAISNWFIRKRTKALVIFTMGSATAGIVAAPAAGWIDPHYGWRVVWVILGCMSLAAAPLAWIAVRRRPEDLGLLPDGDAPEEGTHADGSGAPPRVPIVESPWTVREALRTRTFWLLTVGFLLISMPSGTIFINISAFTQSHGFTKEIAGIVVGIYGFGVLFGRPTWGVLPARIGLHRTMVAYAAVYAASIALFASQSSIIGLYVTVFMLGIAVSAGQLMNAQALPDYFGRDIVGRLTGFSAIANVAVGGSAPLLTAAVFDATGGYRPAFLFFAAACAVAAVALYFARPPVHPSEREPRLAVPAEPATERVSTS